MYTAKLDRVPMYLKAESPEGLRRIMIKNNIKLGVECSYFDIQFVNGNWFAWFNIEEAKPLLKENNGTSDGSR